MPSCRLAALLFIPLLAACGQQDAAAPTASQESASSAATNSPPLQGGVSDWRAVATAEDQARYTRITEAWDVGLKQARTEFDADVTKAGAALSLGAGIAGPIQPPPGDYLCQEYRLGGAGQAVPGFVHYPAFRCQVELTPGGDLIFTQLTGAPRTQGLIYPDTEDRGVYLGTRADGEKGPFPAYGQTPERNQIGAFERMSPSSWRIVFPFPREGANLVVVVLERQS